MGEVMMTAGSGFEGYDVTDYLGFVNVQTVVGSNFYKEFAANITDLSENENEKLTAKLEALNENMIEKLKKSVERRKANALIGLRINYTQFSGNNFGVILSGTAVSIQKRASKDKVIDKELYVSNYYNRLVPRPVRVRMNAVNKDVTISVDFYNYNQDDIRGIRADVELTNLYEEKLLLKNLDFSFDRGNVTMIESEPVECKLPAKDLMLLKDAKVVISKYVTSRGVFAVNDNPINVEMPLHRLASLKEKRGIDAVAKAGTDECVVCGRKQDDMKSTSKFNPDEMIDKMRTKEYVIEIKDVLMEYIKEIDNQYRMELLEIMESGLQYEKTRGNMKETVIEKVEKVFEGH